MASMASAGLAGSRAIGDAIGRGYGRGLRDAGGDRTLGGGKKTLKPKEKKDTSGTTGDPDNPNLDELREGIFEPVEDRFPVQGGRRRRSTMLTDGDGGRFSSSQKTFLGQ